MEGRYINIVIPGRTEYLTLCEVEVDGTLSGKSCPILLVCSGLNEHIMVFGVLLIILISSYHINANICNFSETNVARLGQVSQSSKYGNAKPENAIDGNRASNFNQGSCACTNNNLNPWWRLDLLKTYKINTVTITNRQDCCPERINGAEIRIGNSLNDNGNANPRCAVISSIAAGASQTFACNGMEGRYINIVIPGRTEYLTLCEVEVDAVAPANIS
uniref:Fucolectin tachylectin-4 pentraxin-1 domain-containing protein n=1 Tax=Maylandia zebra TaxID=106582 RepID=A0A3P9DJT8_9CICH